MWLIPFNKQGFLCTWCVFMVISKISSFDFSLPEDYDKEITPKADNGSVEVFVRLRIDKILEIDVENNMFALDMYVYLKWKDERLVITENSDNSTNIQLNFNHAEKIWKPNVHAWGMRDLVIRKGMRNLGRLTISKEKTITFVVGITIRASCDFNFDMYPFDQQFCSMKISSYPDSYAQVRLKWGIGNLSIGFGTNYVDVIRTPRYVTKVYKVNKSLIVNGVSATMSALQFCLKMRRQIMNHILQVYLPSGIFVVVSWGSFLINPEIVPGRMVLLVTNLLTLITMLEGITSYAPPSLNIQAIIVWMLFCIFCVVFALLEYACLLFQSRSKFAKDKQLQMNNRQVTSVTRVVRSPTTSLNDKKTKRLTHWCSICNRKIRIALARLKAPFYSAENNWNILDKLSLILFPFTFVICNLCYWISYFSTEDTNDCE